MKTSSCLLLLALTPGLALGQPIVKSGDCPMHYYGSGGYCIPMAGAEPAIIKNADCPMGYISTGNYCTPLPRAREAIPKAGDCPMGYLSSGNYCMKP